MSSRSSKKRRQERLRRESPYLVVVCEGETEKGYFNWLKNHFRLNQMDVLRPDETNPKAILAYAVKKQQSLSAEGVSAEVWLVFDAESV